MSTLPVWLAPRVAGFSIAVQVQPGARRSAIVGTHGDRLKVAVTAPAESGRANAALLALLAGALGLPQSCLRVVSGAASRRKRIEVDAPLAPQHLAALQPPPP